MKRGQGGRDGEGKWWRCRPIGCLGNGGIWYFVCKILKGKKYMRTISPSLFSCPAKCPAQWAHVSFLLIPSRGIPKSIVTLEPHTEEGQQRNNARIHGTNRIDPVDYDLKVFSVHQHGARSTTANRGKTRRVALRPRAAPVPWLSPNQGSHCHILESDQYYLRLPILPKVPKPFQLPNLFTLVLSQMKKRIAVVPISSACMRRCGPHSKCQSKEGKSFSPKGVYRAFCQYWELQAKVSLLIPKS